MDDANALPLLSERHDDQVAVLRLNRPHRLNAVSLPLYTALANALAVIARDRKTRAVVIAGEGRAFCVGADLKAHGSSELTNDDKKHYVQTGQRVYRALQTLPQPVVAAVHGHAIGAGLELALACDFIVVSEEAKLRLPETTLGTFVGGGTVFTLAQRVGLARAKEMILLGDFFNARDQVAEGLANRVVASQEVYDTAIQLAVKLASHAPVSIQLAKELLNASQRMNYDESMAAEGDALLRCMNTKDWREGVDAFQAKREPHYRGE